MNRRALQGCCALAVALVGVCLAFLVGPAAGPAAAAGSAPTISVVGNQLESNGAVVQLRGVNRDVFGGCVSPSGVTGFPDGPTDLVSVQTMLSWGINTVRLPLNEGCWIGDPSSDVAVQSAYRTDVENYVNLLTSQGQYVILALQFTAPQGYASNTQDYFADATQTTAFWSEVAQQFASDPNVLFDPFSEPAASQYNGPDYASGTYGYTAADAGKNWSFDDIWNCWLNGCSNVPSVYGVNHNTAGINTLISTIRGTGASNPILVNSPDFSFGYDETCSGGVSCFAKYTPTGSGLVIDAHIYDFDVDGAMPLDSNGNADPTPAEEQQRLTDAMSIFTSSILPLAKTYPLMLGELGESDCDNGDGSAPFVQGFLSELDSSGATIGVTPWTWDSDFQNGAAISSGWQCPTKQYGADGSLLIRDYNGTPTSMGQVYKTWLLSKTTVTAPPPTTTTTSPPPPPVTTTTAATTPAPTPAVHSAPHVAVTSRALSCAGATFTNMPKAVVSYTFTDAVSHRRLGSSEHLGLTHAYGRVVSCTATARLSGHTLTATSRSLPVPGRLSATRTGTATLTAVCPRAGGHSCKVGLSLIDSRHHLGAASATLRAGHSGRLSVRLSSAGRRLLARDHRLHATFTTTETIDHVTQTVATSVLTLVS